MVHLIFFTFDFPVCTYRVLILFASLYNQVFFLKKSMFSKIVYLVNEPNLWVSPCIWYENRGFGVYKAERLSNSICLAIVCPFHSMAANLPFLPGSPSFFGWVLTSFVPPAHKQGASSAFLQGHSPMELIPAGYRLILCLQVFADLSFHATAPFGRRFPCIFPVVISYSRLKPILCFCSCPVLIATSING